nr:MFS transporter [uncultured Rhodopila sp.]
MTPGGADARDTAPLGPGGSANRLIVTICTIVATVMQSLDSTIANVTLPYMQGAMSASQEQINWVLTSYIVAAAIMTAPTGFLAARFGRTRLFVTAITGFTIASVLCGLAQSLNQIVIFRVLQGMFGAALVPLSQAVMYDIYPASQRARAMSIWTMGVMIGPIPGPILGGWLTENYSWRWVFQRSARRGDRHRPAHSSRASASGSSQSPSTSSPSRPCRPRCARRAPASTAWCAISGAPSASR